MHPERLDVAAILRRLPLFLEVGPDQIRQLVDTTREKRLQKGEMLFHKGDPPKGFYVVVFGQIKLAFSSAQGNEKVVNILGPQQTFGEAVMFMDRPYPVFAQALADTLLLHVSRSAVFELLERDVSFARHMLAGLSMKLHSLIHDVESYSLRSSAQRLIGYLLQQCGDREVAEGSVECDLPASKQVLASRLNLTPETFSRILHDLSSSGLITVQGRHIVIHDLKRLREH